jgi:hypothetical protein
MVKSMSTNARNADHLVPHQFGSSLRGTPSKTPPTRGAEQPVRGAKLSKSCGVHDDAGPLPPLRR